MNKKSEWKLILVMWSSWTWKWTLIKKLKEREPDYSYPMSITTRAPRDWEISWDVYNFVSEKEFKEKIDSLELLEYAKVHWKWYYGLLKATILEWIKNWRVMIREIDVQWFDSIAAQLDKSLYASIFILPPNEEILRRRIKERSHISDEELDARMKTMKNESKYASIADETIINIDGGEEIMYLDFVKKIKSLT